MVTTCCVLKCRSASHDKYGNKILGVTFHRFPAWRQKEGSLVSDVTKRRRMAWISAIRRANISFNKMPKTLRVCSLHFHSGAKSDDPLCPDWVPSVFTHTTTKKRKMERNMEKYNRKMKKKNKIEEEKKKHDRAKHTPPADNQKQSENKLCKPAYEMCESHPDWAPSINLGHSEVKPSRPDRFARREKRQKTHTTPDWCMPLKEDEEMEATPTAAAFTPKEEDIERVIVGGAESVEEKKPTSECEYCEQRCAEMNRLLEENKALKSDRMNECDFCGLRRTEINRLLEENRALKSELEKWKMEEQFLKGDNEKVKYYTGLPDFEFLMTLLTTVKPYLPQNLRVLSPFQMVFLTLIRLRLNLPVQHLLHLFRSNRKTALTAFGDTISALNAQFSHLVLWPERDVLQASLPQQFVEAFGNCVAVMLDCFEMSINSSPASTRKYLISVTPQGCITFISKGWYGSVSDEHIIENSGILDKLLPGDLVLADRCFKLAEDKAPDSTKVCCHLKAIPKNAEEAKMFTRLRVHVKRMSINIRNKYTILSGQVPPSMMRPCEGEETTLLDKIVAVCCALTNMCPRTVESSSSD